MRMKGSEPEANAAIRGRFASYLAEVFTHQRHTRREGDPTMTSDGLWSKEGWSCIKSHTVLLPWPYGPHAAGY